MPNGRDLYLDQSVESAGECKPCSKKCYWLQENSLPKFCLDLHARGDCLEWPRPRGSDTTPLNQSDVLLWGMLAVILSCSIAIILVVFIILYKQRNHPLLKPLLQRIGILHPETVSRPMEESSGNTAAFSSPEERANLVPESQTPTNVANTVRSQQMQPGAYS